MKEIEFRGKGIIDGQWYYGYYHQVRYMPQPIKTLQSLPDKLPTHWIMYPSSSDWGMPLINVCIEINIDTLGQYIDNNDKNKNKIYDGDILLTDEAGWVAPVVWNYNGFICLKKGSGWSDHPNFEKCEVIGNIHDNLKLLESKK